MNALAAVGCQRDLQRLPRRPLAMMAGISRPRTDAANNQLTNHTDNEHDGHQLAERHGHDGRTRYCNVATGATTWTPPERYQPPPPLPPPPLKTPRPSDLEMVAPLSHFKGANINGATQRRNRRHLAQLEKEPEKPCTLLLPLVLACLLGGQ